MPDLQLFFAPHPALTGVVNNIMIGHTTSNSLQPRLSFPFPPLPEHCILFYPYDKPIVEDAVTKKARTLFACTVTGPQTERTILSLGHNHLMVKIGLQPGALYRLLGIPMCQMVDDKEYDGETLFGNDLKNVIDALANAKSFEAIKNIADNFMLGQLAKIKKPAAIDYIIPGILKYGGMVKIDQLAKNACMSNRQFERAFKDRMGLSPKFYSRLVRFGKAWLLKENNPGITWTEVAYECNYFDQMHLIRDFKAFANTNPKEISYAFEKQPFLLKKGIFY